MVEQIYIYILQFLPLIFALYSPGTRNPLPYHSFRFILNPLNYNYNYNFKSR